MWNSTALDTSATTNRRSYFHSAVTRQASSTAKETFYPVIRAPSNSSPPPHAPRHTPHYMPHHMPTPPARTTHPTAPPHHTPASHPHPTRSHTITTPKVACNSQTGVTQIYEAIRTSKVLRGNCMRNCGTPRHPISRPTPPCLSPASRSRTTRPCHIPPTLQHQPSPKSHAIPPRHESEHA